MVVASSPMRSRFWEIFIATVIRRKSEASGALASRLMAMSSISISYWSMMSSLCCTCSASLSLRSVDGLDGLADRAFGVAAHGEQGFLELGQFLVEMLCIVIIYAVFNQSARSRNLRFAFALGLVKIRLVASNSINSPR